MSVSTEARYMLFYTTVLKTYANIFQLSMTCHREDQSDVRLYDVRRNSVSPSHLVPSTACQLAEIKLLYHDLFLASAKQLFKTCMF